MFIVFTSSAMIILTIIVGFFSHTFPFGYIKYFIFGISICFFTLMFLMMFLKKRMIESS